MASDHCPYDSRPASAQGSSCPFSGSSGTGRGCAFSGLQDQQYNTPSPPSSQSLAGLLLPHAPPASLRKSIKNADDLPPTVDEVLAAALGAPTRRVLTRAETLGPSTGWRDGYLSSRHGFCPPSESASPIALAQSPGRVWSDLCSRMPGLVGRGRIREAIREVPMISGDAETIPDAALWAATVCLGILASVYRYEARNDGHEGIALGVTQDDEDDGDEEEETKGIPRNITVPLRQVCLRVGRPLPHLSQYDVSLYNYKIRDPTSVVPYMPRCENMDLRWPVFNDRAEAMFLLCMAESHGCFTPGVELIAQAQERMLERDNDGLLRVLVKLKEIIDQLGYVFHKISVNPGAGENFANPVEWGQRYAKFSAPLSKRVPALSGLALPVFQLLDAFFGRKKYDTFLGLEALHLRAWLPLNIRAFIAAVEQFPIPTYVMKSGDPRLLGVFQGLVESYAGERGFMGTHRYKVYGFLEVVAKTGRTETNGGAGSTDTEGRPWEEVHRTLSDSMIERLDPYRNTDVDPLRPQEMRGCFEECRFKAKISERSPIDDDPERCTARISIDIKNSGITWGPGDRLAIMPLNSWRDVFTVSHMLDLTAMLDDIVPLEAIDDWKRYSSHEALVSKDPGAAVLTVQTVLRKGHLAPLTKSIVLAVNNRIRATSPTVLDVLGSDTWPVQGSLGDLLGVAKREVDADTWERAFPLDDISWLPKLVPVEVPRTYSISSHCAEMLPSTVELTVSRVDHRISPLLGLADELRAGVSSGFLNPHPDEEKALMRDAGLGAIQESVLVGISRPLNFQLPISQTAPVAMFAGGSGIAPFRSFWNARAASGAVGRNILFLGVQSRKKFSYEQELRDQVHYNNLELHVAFSRDTNGLVYDAHQRTLYDKKMEARYIDTAIIEQGNTICDLVMPMKLGGMGGYLYICGSVSVYETVMSGIKKAIYMNRAMTPESADELLATAFAERRFMLDIFMTPRAMSKNEPIIPVSELSRHTGHSDEDPDIWIGVHGSVYNVTDFLPIHPGGSLIVQASAGLDASRAFDDLAHTSNPEVTSLLSRYFVGYLAPKPSFKSSELGALYDSWYDYLRTSVESLTTLSFEVKSLLKDQQVWFSGGYLNMGGVRKFYQFQSRLMQEGFATLFDSKLKELYLKLTFHLVHQDGKYPDVIGAVQSAQNSAATRAVNKEIAMIGELVCNSTTAQSLQSGLLAYSKAAIKLDVRFLELVREEICRGMDAFELAHSMKSANIEKQRLFKLSSFLVSTMERIAGHLDSFYTELSTLSVYHPELEQNPARARWKSLRRRIHDGTFFVLSHSVTWESTAELDDLETPLPAAVRPSTRKNRDTIDFDQVLSHYTTSRLRPVDPAPQPRAGLADRHTRRAERADGSSYNEHVDRRANTQISKFIASNMKAIRRVSRVPLMQPPLVEAPRPLNIRAKQIPGRPPSSEKSSRSSGSSGRSTPHRRGTSSPVERMRREKSPGDSRRRPREQSPVEGRTRRPRHVPSMSLSVASMSSYTPPDVAKRQMVRTSTLGSESDILKGGMESMRRGLYARQ